MEPLTADEILAVLHSVERGEVTIENLGHGYSGDEECRLSNGWRFWIFNDCYEWDYIDRVETPDGRSVNLWAFMKKPEWRECRMPVGRERNSYLDAIENADGMTAIRVYKAPSANAWGW